MRLLRHPGGPRGSIPGGCASQSYSRDMQPLLSLRRVLIPPGSVTRGARGGRGRAARGSAHRACDFRTFTTNPVQFRRFRTGSQFPSWCRGVGLPAPHAQSRRDGSSAPAGLLTPSCNGSSDSRGSNSMLKHYGPGHSPTSPQGEGRAKNPLRLNLQWLFTLLWRLQPCHPPCTA